MKQLYKNKRIIIIISSIILLILLLILYLFSNNNENKEDVVLSITTENLTTKKEEKEIFYVDVKGNVKKPGVYTFKENERVKDAIEKAGGLTKNANTDNINLSQKLTNEMVIYVYSNFEINNGSKIMDCSTKCENYIIEVNNCIEKEEDLININTATLEELQTLTGIGESKAKNIIEYREENDGFKNIEEIKNITGIGEALYEKIKDKITT